jgi:hypothetical protein
MKGKSASFTWLPAVPSQAVSEICRPKITSMPMPIEDEQIREALDAHWRASAAGDANAEHDIYADDAICEYPQSGFNVKRILGNGNLWITEYTITYQGRPAYTVSIMEFSNGRVVHETQYFADPFEAPGWRRQWVQQV